MKKVFLFILIFSCFSFKAFSASRPIQGYFLFSFLDEVGIDTSISVYNNIGARFGIGVIFLNVIDIALNMNFLYGENYSKKYNKNWWNDRDPNIIETEKFHGFIFDVSPTLKFKYGISEIFDMAVGLAYKYRIFNPSGDDIDNINLHGVTLIPLDFYLKISFLLINAGIDLDFMFSKNAKDYSAPAGYSSYYEPSSMKFFFGTSFRIGVGMIF